MEDISKYREIISELSSLRAVAPRPAFRARFENLLIPALPSKKAGGFFFSFAVRLAILLIAFIVFGTTGIVLAAGQSKPGSFLYPVRQLVQNAKLAVATNPSTRALLHLEKARDKVEEMQTSASDRKTEQFEQKAEDYKKDIGKAVEEVQKSGIQQEKTAETVNEFLENQTRTLEELMTAAPTQNQPALEKAIDASQQGQEKMLEVQPENIPTPSNQSQSGNNEFGQEKANEHRNR
ncbi:MAG: hypothetical protein UV73_C0022G0004 [Candidatus Gottesmanbacteria bacterium GW2011_GWA2_43_14]|uniref:DUF5667 domain-containing protein n=1 Tax=Candidatus Gottesmanbacteria bacterium GW2011_GWA2_43_14 TaxID=1618443 RepID=A0A0G1DB92_9BACT|nr:MAG: hypothetical protein UV73_C0022G0004 [Candidatus Gottesmanbacteria bacterium GW2011_GWA2_43_14]